MIYKTIKQDKYQCINNEVFTLPISEGARCLLAYMLTKPADWKFYNKSIMNEFKINGSRLKKYLKELKDYGLVRKYRIQVTGRLEWITEVYESLDLVHTGSNSIGSISTDTNSIDSQNTDILSTDNNQVLTIQNTDNNSMIKKNKKIDDTAVELSELLAKRITENYSFIKIDKNKKLVWAKDIEKIHRIDGYDWEIIKGVICWSQEDSFWKQNIRSGAKLRKQFDTLLVRIKSEPKRLEIIS